MLNDSSNKQFIVSRKKKKTKNKYPIIIMNGSEDAVFICSVKNVLNKGDPPFYWYYEV